MGQNGTAPGANGRRKPGEHFSPAEKEELGYEAYELSVVRKWTYREIAAELGVNKNSVGSLIEQERTKRRLEHRDQIQDSAATYSAVEAEAWRRLAAFPDARGSMGCVGFLNNILNARTRKDALYGHDAPKEIGFNRRDNIDLSSLPNDELQEIIALEEQMRAIARRALPQGGDE
jgi:transposase-like protein